MECIVCSAEDPVLSFQCPQCRLQICGDCLYSWLEQLRRHGLEVVRDKYPLRFKFQCFICKVYCTIPYLAPIREYHRLITWFFTFKGRPRESREADRSATYYEFAIITPFILMRSSCNNSLLILYTRL